MKKINNALSAFVGRKRIQKLAKSSCLFHHLRYGLPPTIGFMEVELDMQVKHYKDVYLNNRVEFEKDEWKYILDPERFNKASAERIAEMKEQVEIEMRHRELVELIKSKIKDSKTYVVMDGDDAKNL